MAGPAKVTAIRLPTRYGREPQDGVPGIRARLGVTDRALVMAIFKPALGLAVADYAAILDDVCAAGIDIIKDDEIVPDSADSPAMARWLACKPVIARHASEGRHVLYAVNVTGAAHTLVERARELVAAGANALLINVLSHGFSVLEALRDDPLIGVPLFAHPALAGALCGAPDHGFTYPVILGTLMARAGADAVLYPAHYGSLPFAAADEFAIRDALRERGAFPVPSAGIHPGVVPRVIGDYGNDVILNAGTGIMDHPDGPGAGVRAFHEALVRFRDGLPLDDSVPAGPLKAALAKWGTA
jgi:2,3-diketo-5-methylthiopentyl-1-phosphate enolase